jgi:hypothetical protein
VRSCPIYIYIFKYKRCTRKFGYAFKILENFNFNLSVVFQEILKDTFNIDNYLKSVLTSNIKFRTPFYFLVCLKSSISIGEN